MTSSIISLLEIVMVIIICSMAVLGAFFTILIKSKVSSVEKSGTKEEEI